MKKSIVIILAIILLALGAVYVWRLLSSSSNSPVPNNQNSRTTTSSNAADQGINTSRYELVAYSNPDKNYTFNYPKDFKIQRWGSEFYRNEEYPSMGLHIGDSQAVQGSFEQIVVVVYDQNWFDYSGDLANRKIIDLTERQIGTINDLKKEPEFIDAKIIDVNGLIGLTKMLNKRMYTIVQNPGTPGEFVIFEVTEEGGDKVKEVIAESYNVLNIILASFSFIN